MSKKYVNIEKTSDNARRSYAHLNVQQVSKEISRDRGACCVVGKYGGTSDVMKLERRPV